MMGEPMTLDLQIGSPLRLPRGQVETAAVLPPDGLRARLEELGRVGFGGRLELQAHDWLAELLLREGRPLAAALGGPGLAQPLRGQEALAALLEQAGVPWTCRLAPLEALPLAALAGVGAAPRALPLPSAQALRGLLRELAERGEDGILELSLDGRWARALVAGGKLLGAYSETSPRLAPSLIALGELLRGTVPRAAWYPAAEASELALPAPSVAEASFAEIEQRVIWIVSSFEGALGRARERGADDEVHVALLELLTRLQRLARALEAARGGAEGLDAALARLDLDVRPADRMAEIDPHLQQLTPAQAWPRLTELAMRALERIALACPEPAVAQYCHQARFALEAELQRARAVAPRMLETSSEARR